MGIVITPFAHALRVNDSTYVLVVKTVIELTKLLPLEDLKVKHACGGSNYTINIMVTSTPHSHLLHHLVTLLL